MTIYEYDFISDKFVTNVISEYCPMYHSSLNKTNPFPPNLHTIQSVNFFHFSTDSLQQSLFLCLIKIRNKTCISGKDFHNKSTYIANSHIKNVKVTKVTIYLL